MKANLLRVELRVVTDVGSVTVKWDDLQALLELTDPNPRTPARTVREITESVVSQLSKLARDAARGAQ